VNWEEVGGGPMSDSCEVFLCRFWGAKRALRPAKNRRSKGTRGNKVGIIVKNMENVGTRGWSGVTMDGVGRGQLEERR